VPRQRRNPKEMARRKANSNGEILSGIGKEINEDLGRRREELTILHLNKPKEGMMILSLFGHC
jgi:hypothetical protein